jgi:hypothetical protein
MNTALALRDGLLNGGCHSCREMQHCVGPQGKRAGAGTFTVYWTHAATVIDNGEGFAWGGRGDHLSRAHFNAVSCSRE